MRRIVGIENRPAGALTGAVAVTAFGVVSAAAGFTPTEALFVCAVVACAGLLGVRLAENTRRAVSAEASRVILRRFLPSHLVDGDPRAALELVGRR